MKTKNITWGATIAALYVVLTFIAKMFNLDSGVVQVRFSEALCVLPMFTSAAIPGLFVGCLLSNILAGGIVLDVIFGSIATLIGAIGTRLLRKNKILAVIPPILSNTLIVPFVLRYGYEIPGSVPYFMLTVGLGEILSCGVLGLLLYGAFKKTKLFK